MSDASDKLMPGPEGKTPRFYEVDKGHKTESYLTAIHGNPIPPQPSSSNPANPIRYDPVGEKVDLGGEGSVKPRENNRIGLTEQDLSAYRNDPFWKGLRWLLFVLFWLLWLGMFILAILLVCFSPGCALSIRPSWWQTAIAYNIWVPSFQDSDGDGLGDFEGLISRLDNLRKTGVQTIWPSPFLLSDDFSNAIRDHKAIDSKLGVNEVADKFIDYCKYHDLRLVISIPLATTSTQHDWFLKSASASLPDNRNYSNFYYWLNKRPSNPAAMFAVHKNVTYVHEVDQPKAAILNWGNNNVREHMFGVLSSWIDRGVDGFHLTTVEYLARNADFSKPDWKSIYDILKDVRKHVDTYANESRLGKKIAIFMRAEGAEEKLKSSLAETGLDTIVNYELTNVEKNTKVCHISEETVASCAHEILSDVLLFHSLKPNVWPHWELSNGFVSRLSARAGSRSHAELLILLQLMLPGTNSFYYGEEIGMRDLQNDTRVMVQRGAMQWDSSLNAGFSTSQNSKIPVHPDFVNVNWQNQWKDEKSPLKMFSKLAKLRQRDETIMQGETLISSLIDHHAFTLTRFPSSEATIAGQIYVCAVNFGKSTSILPLESLPHHGSLEKVQIVVATSNSIEWRSRNLLNLSEKTLALPSDTGIVFKYSPPPTKPLTDH
ncbi:unnamed protein product, partial [Mesorhabditis belari]|uniref:alpha-glucosidase n=1 Tax=Mesorhabditis belari TaxID=2138241 RepID=A0AAF3ENC7_9BILA